MTSLQSLSARIKKFLIFSFALIASVGVASYGPGLDDYFAGNIGKAREILSDDIKNAKTTEAKYHSRPKR